MNFPYLYICLECWHTDIHLISQKFGCTRKVSGFAYCKCNKTEMSILIHPSGVIKEEPKSYFEQEFDFKY